MGNSRIKNLAKAYAIGEINKYDYRLQRSSIIDQITRYSGSTEDASPSTIPFETPNDPQVSLDFEDVEHDDANDLSNAYSSYVDEVETRKQSVTLRLLFIFSALVVVTLIIFKVSNLSISASPDIAKTTVPSIHPQQLVEDFVGKSDWEQSDIAKFLINWSGLSEQQKHQAQQAIWFQGLVDALRDRQTELNALADTGDKAARQKEEQIKLLAESLDIFL